MRASIVILAGIVVVTLTGVPACWRTFQGWGDLVNSVQGPFTTRIWARQLDMDEADVRRVFARFVRWLWFACGVAMVIGGVVFLVQNGWAWDW